jgi:hypothetical protein
VSNKPKQKRIVSPRETPHPKPIWQPESTLRVVVVELVYMERVVSVQRGWQTAGCEIGVD